MKRAIFLCVLSYIAVGVASYSLGVSHTTLYFVQSPEAARETE